MFRLAALIGLMTAPAVADVARISNCVIDKQDWYSPIFCDVENLSDTAIAEFRTAITITEEGRTIPWVADNYQRTPKIAQVPGGIEPGETRNLWIWQVSVPEGANWEKLRVNVQPIWFADINGAEISSP